MGEFLNNLLPIPPAETKFRSGSRYSSDSKKYSKPYKIKVMDEEQLSFVNTYKSQKEVYEEKSNLSDFSFTKTKTKSTKTKKTQFPLSPVKLDISLDMGQVHIWPNSLPENTLSKETFQGSSDNTELITLKEELQSKDSEIGQLKQQIELLASEITKYQHNLKNEREFDSSNSPTVMDTLNGKENTDMNLSDCITNDNLWLYHMEKQARFHSTRINRMLPSIHQDKQTYKYPHRKKQSSRYSNFFKK